MFHDFPHLTKPDKEDPFTLEEQFKKKTMLNFLETFIFLIFQPTGWCHQAIRVYRTVRLYIFGPLLHYFPFFLFIISFLYGPVSGG